LIYSRVCFSPIFPPCHLSAFSLHLPLSCSRTSVCMQVLSIKYRYQLLRIVVW
jgi:hypothetical protein